jgi:hypothetical protein
VGVFSVKKSGADAGSLRLPFFARSASGTKWTPQLGISAGKNPVPPRPGFFICAAHGIVP